MLRLSALAVLAAIASLGCEKKTATGGGVASASARTSVPAAPGAVALVTPTAFELVPSRAGATLVFASAQSGAIEKLELDGDGAVTGVPTPVLGRRPGGAEPSDLAAAWVGDRLGLAWVERQGPKARVRAAFVPRERAGNAEPAVLDLGGAWAGPRMARGNVAVAARGDAALVFARGEPAPCLDAGQKGCFGFAFHEISATETKKGGLPLTVPVPCTDDSALLTVRGDRFHYGVCTEADGAPLTTMFTIERSPEYARADRLLAGCKPLGMPTFGGALWLVGDCQGSRRAARVGGREDAAEYLDLRSTHFVCEGDGARIRGAGLDLRLDEPRGGLTPLLPPEVAPPRSRAAWSGRALLVASALGEALGVTRFGCRGGVLSREAVALGAAVPSR